MAIDWIKMRADLQSHPKVVRILSATKSDKFRVIGGLHAVWCVFDAHCEDGVLQGYTPETLDHIIGWNGFSSAMVSVGWLIENVGVSLAIPEFSEHNGQSAKRRAEDQKRKRDSRNSPEPVRNLSANDAYKKWTREEKRREEKNKDIRPSDVSITIWDEYVKHRKAKKATISNTVIESLRIDAKSVGLTIEQAIQMQLKRGWTGFDPSWVTASNQPTNAFAGAI